MFCNRFEQKIIDHLVDKLVIAAASHRNKYLQDLL